MTEPKKSAESIFDELSAPFHPNQLEWRAGATTRDKERAMALPYVDSREIMERLDRILGPNNWKHTIVPNMDNIVVHLSIRVGDEWITRSGIGSREDGEGQRGGDLSAAGKATYAFRRAAAAFGISRYLWFYDAPWVPYNKEKRRLAQIPRLPKEMLPEGFEYTQSQGSASRRSNNRNGSKNGKSEKKEDPLKRALGYKIPKPFPSNGKTLEEAMETALGDRLLYFFAGKAPSPKGKEFTPSGEYEEKLQAAAEYIIENMDIKLEVAEE